MISVSGLVKKFGATTALNNVSIRFPDQQIMALIGPNGSGKTTLIKTILGLVLPDAGSVYLHGIEVTRQWAYRSAIGYMPQVGRYPDNMKVGELIDMVKDVRKGNESALDEDLMHSFKLNQLLDKRLYGLSGGQRQKISASLAFLFNPDVLILDEPTAGLDPVSTELFREKIRSAQTAGKQIIITSHVLSELDGLVNGVTFMNEGTVVISDSLEALQSATGFDKLNAIISSFISKKPEQRA